MPPSNGITLERHQALLLVSGTAKGNVQPQQNKKKTTQLKVYYQGRGVFAKSAIPAGTVIETCPVLVFPLGDLEGLKATLVDQYSYNWPVKDEVSGKVVVTQALALGLGSMFNHARKQNVGFQRDGERAVIVYRTLRDVLAGEELCISYGAHLWFEEVDAGWKAEGEELPLEAIWVDKD